MIREFPFEPDADGLPAPFVRGTAASGGRPAAPLRFLIDSGANTTSLPLSAAARMRIDPAAATTIPTVGLERDRPLDVPSVEADLTVFGRRYRLDVLLLDLPYGLLGRDILRDYRVTFDGPAGTLAVAD